VPNPTDRKYHAAHTWLKDAGNGEFEVGITAHAQEELGDVVYVQPPNVGGEVAQGEACGVIESVKTAADLHAPASGVVTAVNAELADVPERLNNAPYETWIFRMTLSDVTQLQTLLGAMAYEQSLG